MYESADDDWVPQSRRKAALNGAHELMAGEEAARRFSNHLWQSPIRNEENHNTFRGSGK